METMLSRCRRAFDEYRARRIAAFLSGSIDVDDRVLDCGCGQMIVTRSVRERVAIEIFGVDVINLNETDMPLCIYDGSRLPFADHSFDVAYLSFVLHHALDPQKVMRECLRVARRWVIVLEDVYGNKLDLVLLKALDWIGNRPFSSAMSLPYHFKSTREWMSIFHDLGARVVRQENVRPLPWRLTRHRMFVVERERRMEFDASPPCPLARPML